MDDFKIDARKWRFLDKPAVYIEHERAYLQAQHRTDGLQAEPLTRQFKTSKEILARFAQGHGVILADDVGLGKTTVGALVAWVVACQGKRVRIYAPNEPLRRRWAEELERHIPMLGQIAASSKRIKQGQVARLDAGCIQVTTHHALVVGQNKGEQRTACDLMIIDEAHRAKGVGSAFNKALQNLGENAKRKLILTATPFSIKLKELEQLLQFVGATEFKKVRCYAERLERLYALGDGHDVAMESERLVSAAGAAIDALQPYVIRHCIDDLSSEEQRHFGAEGPGGWDIPKAEATHEDLLLLLRMDRLLHLTQERKGERRNDPRSHVGWHHVNAEIDRAKERAAAAKRAASNTDEIVQQHICKAKRSLNSRIVKTHPKIAAVSDAIRVLLDEGEKVLVFCHHRATASELLSALEVRLRAETASPSGPPEEVWRAAWESLLRDNDSRDNDALLTPIVDWLCTPGLRQQVGGWLGEPAGSMKSLIEQLERISPRNAGSRVGTISEAARTLKEALLGTQSKSTRSLLNSIAKGKRTLGGKMAHFPGCLDDGLRTMGSWHHDGHAGRPKTLYTVEPDIVIAIFNSPFGPDVLVATDRLSEGVDLHRCCRHLIHYELDPSPVRTLQRNGRVRRVGSWAAMTDQPICYAYPTFGGTRDEKAVAVMRQRINAFGLLLGGVPSLDDDSGDRVQSFVEEVLLCARESLKSLNKKLCVK